MTHRIESAAHSVVDPVPVMLLLAYYIMVNISIMLVTSQDTIEEDRYWLSNAPHGIER